MHATHWQSRADPTHQYVISLVSILVILTSRNVPAVLLKATGIRATTHVASNLVNLPGYQLYGCQCFYHSVREQETNQTLSRPGMSGIERRLGGGYIPVPVYMNLS